MSHNQLIYTICRYFAATMLLLYGFAKINGSQFTVTDSLLDEKLETLSGIGLVWYFFGYSTAYKIAIGLVEIGGGILLLFRRTTLIGSVAMTGVMFNILLIDLLFQIGSGALMMAMFITMSLMIINAFHWQDLVDLFWTQQNPVYGESSKKTAVVTGKMMLKAFILIFSFIATYYLANFSNRSPTPIDGTWDVVLFTPEPDNRQVPERIYFEFNRAYQARFRYSESFSDPLHFTVDSENYSLKIWDTWLDKETKLFDGTYKLNNDTLKIRGIFSTSHSPVDIVLHKVR